MGPWNFFRDVIIFREPRRLQTPNNMTFDELSIWVQCYNLLMVLMHKDFLKKVGSKVGIVEEIDTRENGFAMGHYARLRISIDVNKPLKQCVRVALNKGDE